MKRLLLVALLLVPSFMAQNTPFAPPEQVQRLVSLKYADPQRVAALLRVWGLDSIQPDTNLKVISLSGTKARVASAEEAIKQLDVPSAAPKNIDRA